MRNDARPVGGETSHQSPVAGHAAPDVDQPSDVVVNRDAGVYRPRPEAPVDDKEPILDFEADDQVMPGNDSTLNTKI